MKYISLLILIFIWSCQTTEKTKKPEHLLTKNKMVDILSDIAVLKSASDVNSNKLSKYMENPFDYVCEKYKVDSLTIAQNIEYYNFKFNDNLDIYKSVEEKILNRKQKIDSINTIIDSLKRKTALNQKKKKLSD